MLSDSRYRSKHQLMFACIYRRHRHRHNAAMPYHRLNRFDFHQRVAQTAGTSILFFTNEGCGSCRRWKEILHAYAADNAVTVFEVDAGFDQGLTREFAVWVLPSLFLFADGRYHAPLHSEAQTSKLHDAVLAALADAAQEPP